MNLKTMEERLLEDIQEVKDKTATADNQLTDTQEMIVDHEYRLTLMELGL